jgi:hypothetical protein
MPRPPNRRNLRRTSEETVRAEKWIIGFAAPPAIGIGLWAVYAPSTSDAGVAGTVAAAKRYQGTPLSADAVKLGDTKLQALLQSDAFDRLRRDPELRKNFVKLTKDPGFVKVMNNPEFAHMLANDTASLASQLSSYNSAAVNYGLTNTNLQFLLNDASFVSLIGQPDMQAALTNPDVLNLLGQMSAQSSAQDIQMAASAFHLALALD